MTTAATNPHAESNRAVIRLWCDRWCTEAICAARSFAAVFDRIVPRMQSFEQELASACADQEAIVSALGIGTVGGQ